MNFKKNKNPYFSIITVVKNDEVNIKNTIKSVTKQSFKNFEYIIIDGKSKDNTLKNIIDFKKKITKIVSKKDKGIYYAMNKGIKLSKGKVVVFVNSGDTLKLNALKTIHNIFEKNIHFEYVFGTVLRHYTKTSILKYGVNIKKLYFNFDFATSHSTGFFLKRKNFEKYGLFNTNYKCSSDYDLYYRLIIKNKIIGGSTKRSQLIGEVQKGGYSSKISFTDHVIEEAKIRLDNDQNKLVILAIILNSFFKKIFF